MIGVSKAVNQIRQGEVGCRDMVQCMESNGRQLTGQRRLEWDGTGRNGLAGLGRWGSGSGHENGMGRNGQTRTGMDRSAVGPGDSDAAKL